MGRNVSCVTFSAMIRDEFVFHRRPCQGPQGLAIVFCSVSLLDINNKQNNVTEPNTATGNTL